MGERRGEKKEEERRKKGQEDGIAHTILYYIPHRNFIF